MVKKTRKFNGKIYRLYDSFAGYHKKTASNKRVKEFRKKGYYARVVKHKTFKGQIVYSVYIRKK